MVLPHNKDAERAVLGTVLVASERIHEVADVLLPVEFYSDAHRRIFEAMLVLGDKGRFDILTLIEHLTRAGVLDDVGGPAYVAGLADGVPASTNLPYYARIVRDLALRRDLITAANRILTHAYYDSESGAEALEVAEQAVYALAARSTGGAVVDMVQLAGLTMEVFDQVAQTGHAVVGMPTGLTDLDDKTRGMQRGQMIVVAGRPGMGKSTFGTCVARNVAQPSGTGVLMFSLEMSKEEIGVRLAVAEAQVDGHDLQRGLVPQAQMVQLGQGLATLAGTRIFVDETPHRTVSQVRSIVRRERAQREIGLVVIDYLNLMAVDRRRGEEKRTLELGDITRGLKLLAKELRMPIMVLAALNREPDQRKRSERPKLSDLAESGAIERDADQVWFLHRPDDDEPVMEVVVAKNRSGPKGVVRVAYFEEQFRFANLAALPDGQ